MANEDRDAEYQRRLLSRQRRRTVRQLAVQDAATIPPPERSDATQPHLELDRPGRSTMKIQSFRARALEEYVARLTLAPDLTQLLDAVMKGRRDSMLAHAVGTDELGLRDLERRFEFRVGRSVYVAAVEVVNRAARLRRDFTSGA